MTSACMSGLPSPGLVIWMRNPFEPSDRQVSHVFGSPTIAQWMSRDGIEFDQPTLILKNGQPVLMAHRAVTPIDAGDVVALVTLPQGGGGGGKNPLRTVLMIAVLVVANAYGGALAASLGYSGTLATAVASTAIAVTGSVLVNALVPLPNQSLPSASANTTSPSPTYSLQARGNYGRLSQPVPVIYGHHLVYPDLATMPYTEYENNEEYLHQLHVIGVGHFQFEELSIDDSRISSFAEVQAQVIEPGGQNTLFNPDVVTAPEVSGQELIAVTDAGSIVGPFALNPVGTLINQIGVDVVMLRGLYYANDSGALESRSVQWRVEVRSINDDGDATSGWLHVADETYSAATNTAQRLSFKYSVSPGRYEIRLQRLDARDTSNRAGHELRWGQAKGYLAGSSLPTDLTYLALRMRATDNLSQRSSRLVNCLVTRKLSIWNPSTGWSALQPTRSIAWAFADAVKSNYGAGLPDRQLDLAALARLDAVWSARGDAFNAVFDQNQTVWDALGQIARTGRAVPFLQGGIVRLVRDEAKTIPVALFSARNIVRNSLKIQYLMPGDATADAVTIEYVNPKSWKPDEFTVSLSGSQAAKPARVRLFGCTDKAQGIREGKYIAAATDHEELYVTGAQALEVIPQLPRLYDEPFADSSQIPTFLVAQLARQHVTVSLSGDAGDELFCGYNRYLMADRLWRRIKTMPRPLRHLLARSLHALAPNTWSSLSAPLMGLLPVQNRHANVGDKLHKLAGILDVDNVSALYQRLVSHWHCPADVVLGSEEPSTLLQTVWPALENLGEIERMMALDLVTYLPDDNLVKVDRAAMGNSLESRVPMLDQRVVEFACSLPLEYKLRDGVTKWVLREVLYRYVPRELIERPKMGFGVPIDTWLRGPLRDWAETLLAAPRLRAEGFFDPAPIRRKWAEHLSGQRNWQYHLWDVLMFQAWLEENHPR